MLRLNKIPAVITTTLCVVGLGLLVSACAGDNGIAIGNDNNGVEGSPQGLSGHSANRFPTSIGASNGGDGVHSGPRQIIKNPTLEQVLQKGPLEERALGNPNAPVTVIKYASLTCPICRKFQRLVFPEFKRTYIDTGKVHFILRQFPIGRSAGNATIALRCAPKSKYFALYDKFLNQQSKWVSQEVRLDAIYTVAKQVGMSRAQFDECLKNQVMIQGLQKVKDRGRTLGVIGTPNFFIQNKLIKRALNMDGLRAEIDPLLNRTAVSAATSSAAQR